MVKPYPDLRYLGLFASEAYLVLAHAMAGVEDDPVSHHVMVIRWVVVKAVVGHASILQLQSDVKQRGQFILL